MSHCLRQLLHKKKINCYSNQKLLFEYDNSTQLSKINYLHPHIILYYYLSSDYLSIYVLATIEAVRKRSKFEQCSILREKNIRKRFYVQIPLQRKTTLTMTLRQTRLSYGRRQQTIIPTKINNSQNLQNIYLNESKKNTHISIEHFVSFRATAGLKRSQNLC